MKYTYIYISHTPEVHRKSQTDSSVAVNVSFTVPDSNSNLVSDSRLVIPKKMSLVFEKLR